MTQIYIAAAIFCLFCLLAPPLVAKVPRHEVVVFQSPGFPTVDGPVIPWAVLEKALGGTAYCRADVEELREILAGRQCRLLVMPYGSAFPAAAWPDLAAYLDRGGNLLVLGGAPFHQPVLWDKAGKRRQLGPWGPDYARELSLGPAEALAVPTDHNPTVDFPPGTGFPAATPWRKPGPGTVYTLTVRFADEKEFPGEDGSWGPYLAEMRPLVHLLGEDGLPGFAPIVEIDHLRGTRAGARWVFAACDASLTPTAIRACMHRALQGAVSLRVLPVHASLKSGETPRIRVSLHRPGTVGQASFKARLKISDEKGREVASQSLALAGPLPTLAVETAIQPDRPPAPGLYRAKVTLEDAGFQPLSAVGGFWIEDRDLLGSGPRLSASSSWLRKDGAVFPVVGTTYMDNLYQRKFLLSPNPAVWDDDFRRMRTLGINFVRTGIWAGFTKHMDPDGNPDPVVLRSLDAYVQAAARHGIVICFTFFAFLPPSFGAANPYLDAAALQKQRVFIETIAARYRGVGWIHFDLINEPSYAPPQALWQTRPVGDPDEKKLWRDYLEAGHGKDPARILARLGAAAGDPFALPRERDFSYSRIKGGCQPRRALDFILFSQRVFADWAGSMRDTIKNVNPDVMITVGQDEGGAVFRPGQQYFAPAVDYTSMHTWWFNDDLTWDGLVTRVPGKPHLVSETGLMRLEDSRGMPWRSPGQAAALVERKFAAAFASGCAGVVQWTWHINPYQPLDNEAVIGCFRVDGTAKPELLVSGKFADFFSRAAPYLDDFEPSQVVLVLPHSRLFSGRPGGLEGTQKIVRVLTHHFDLFPDVVPEYTLTPGKLEHAKLVIVPTSEVLAAAAAETLLQAARSGRKVLLIGPLEGNPYGEIDETLRELGAVYPGPALALTEAAGPGLTNWVTFDRGVTQYLRKGSRCSASFDRDNTWYEPLPLDFADGKEGLINLFKRVLPAVGIDARFSATPLPCRLLYMPRVVLGVCINESSRPLQKNLTFQDNELTIEVEPGRARLFLINRSDGSLLLID